MWLYKTFMNLLIGVCFVWSIIETLLVLNVGTCPTWIEHYSSGGHAVLAILFAWASVVLWDLKET